MTGAPELRPRCGWHPEREAAALCLECQRSLCRECAVEEEGRIWCRPCLERRHAPAAARARRRAPAWLRNPLWRQAPLGALGLGLAYAVFYVMLTWLANTPGTYLLR